MTRKESANRLKVIFQPYWNDNPYQKLLIKHLADLGVDWKGERLTSLLVKGKLPDVVHLHWLHAFFVAPNNLKSYIKLAKLISRLLILKLIGVKIVWTAHNLKDHDNRNPALDRVCTNLVVKLSDAVITHSETAKSTLVKKFNMRNNDKVYIVPHGNYIGYYENKVTRMEARKAIGIPHSSLCLLFMGLIRPYKGVPKLIKDFKKIQHGDAQLIITGKVSDVLEREWIEQEAKGQDAIKFLPGYVADQQIQLYMNACDAVVFPYGEIFTSGAMLMAMSFSRACIAPAKGCINEILNNSGAILYDPESENGLEQAIKFAIQQKDQLIGMGECNRQLAEQWNWNSIARRTLEVYTKI